MMGKTVKRWAILAIVVPLAAAGARRISDAVEKRRGSSRLTRALRSGADMLHRGSRRGRRW
jgi:hypothetical protein